MGSPKTTASKETKDECDGGREFCYAVWPLVHNFRRRSCVSQRPGPTKSHPQTVDLSLSSVKVMNVKEQE